MNADLERWMDRYFLNRMIERAEEPTNPGLRGPLYTADIIGIPVDPWFTLPVDPGEEEKDDFEAG